MLYSVIITFFRIKPKIKYLYMDISMILDLNYISETDKRTDKNLTFQSQTENNLYLERTKNMC